MAPQFGTSGLRGLVVELTEQLVADYTRAFIAACDCGGTIFVGQDLRPSSHQIANFVIASARNEGIDVVDCGALPTPALALASMNANASAIMVTGSHIPADRNGLKFYVPSGEISKANEQNIIAALDRPPNNGFGDLQTGYEASDAFEARYVNAFGTQALLGLRIGIYQHSSVARDIMFRIIAAMGAEAIPLGRSDVFIPVDTEALAPETRTLLAGWCDTHKLDAIVSTDGDGDRPMLANQNGDIVAGDILGVLTARYLGADVICTPVSSNSMVQQMDCFQSVELTRIGSPFVIAAMENVLAKDIDAKVVGYEANGGFLLGFKSKSLTPLMTRDSLLPMLAPLIQAQENGCLLSDLVSNLPPVFTAADRLQNVAVDLGQTLLNRLGSDENVRKKFFEGAGTISNIDHTDGMRVSFENGNVVHLRPSGNAPEFRCYAEANKRKDAIALVEHYLRRLKHILLP